jgi:hypothetical protein
VQGMCQLFKERIKYKANCFVLYYFFKTDKEHLLIAGDTSHYQQQFADNVFAAVNVDYKKSQETCTVNNGQICNG